MIDAILIDPEYRNRIVYTYVPHTALGENGEYYPRVTELCNGIWSRCTEYVVSFENEKMAMAIARELARETAALWRDMAEAFIESHL